MLVKTAVVLILLQLGSVQGCPDQQCQALVEEVAELKEGMAELKTEIQKLKESMGLLLEQHETMSKEHTSTKQKTNKKFEAIQETLDSIKMQMAEADEHTQTFRNESDQKATQIKEELSDIKQKTETGFTAVQDTLGDLEAEQQKAGGGLQTLRSETAQLALTVGRNITLIKEELSDVKQSAKANFTDVGVKLTTIKGELVGIKQRTNTSFTAVQDTLGDLEAEQQKVGGGLETLRSETAQLALTVGRNITQIKEELSGGFEAVKVNLEDVEMRQLEMKEDIQELKNGTSEGSITVAYPYIATTCSEIIERIHNSPPGYYQLRAPNGTITTEYCPMECKKCLAIKSTGGWKRVAYLNMTDPTHQCPSSFRLFTEPRRCSPGTSDYFFGCATVTYPVHGIQYQRVCGRVIAYHKGNPRAFTGGLKSIDTYYVDGVSLTHGSPPNKHHIWTFAAARDEQSANYQSCPCSNTSRTFTGRVPDYVGDDYFCDSGTRVWTRRGGAGFDEVYTEDPLWDGSGCGPTSSCCTFNSPPWFCKELPQPTTDDIELRACRYTTFRYRDVQIKQIELYAQ